MGWDEAWTAARQAARSVSSAAQSSGRAGAGAARRTSGVVHRMTGASGAGRTGQLVHAVDGAGPWQRFRDLLLPLLKPLLYILTALSVLWDFRVFTQIYVLQSGGGINSQTNVMGVYAFRTATGQNRFDLGSAIAVVMVVMILLLTVGYLRQMVRQEAL